MPIWHLGASVFLFRWIFRDPRVDLRFLALGALAPDLVDVPLAMVLGFPHDAHRLWGHTLAAAGLVMAVVLLARRRGRPRKPWMALSVGVFLHLLLDGMWALPETLLWPFLGVAFTPTGVGGVADLWGRVGWWALAGEAVAGVYLALIWAWAPPEDRAGFRSTGVLTVGEPPAL